MDISVSRTFFNEKNVHIDNKITLWGDVDDFTFMIN